MPPINPSASQRAQRTRRLHRGGGRANLSAPESATWNVYNGKVPGTRLQLRLDQTVTNIVGLYDAGTIMTTSTSTQIGYQFEFQANFWTGFSSCAACFDQYKVKMMEVYVEPSYSAPSVTGKFYTVVDYDDVNSMSVGSAQQYSNVIDASINQGRVYRFVPHTGYLLQSGSNNRTGNIASDTVWIDCADPTVQHFGVKMVSDLCTAAVNVTLRCRVWFQFRNQI